MEFETDTPNWLVDILECDDVADVPCNFAHGLFELKEYDHRPVEFFVLSDGWVRFFVGEYGLSPDRDTPVYHSLFAQDESQFWSKVRLVVAHIEKREPTP
jgi:hypothetical protein